jgi:excisionase family DNA binding protein
MAKKPVEPRSVEEVWLSLEQVAAALAVPWTTIRRWARDGDARVPAYKVWDEGDGRHGRYRFKKSDVVAFQTLTSAQDPAPVLIRKR